MNSVLKEIIEQKRHTAATAAHEGRPRKKALLDARERLRVMPFIAEIKKSSPSSGTIAADIDICAQAELYRRGGAGCISVLTESSYFNGSTGDLEKVAKSVGLPVLCKDFIVHERQIESAFAAGADMVLLIAAILTEAELERLTGRAVSLGMQVLHEIHRPEEFLKLANLDLTMVGVNARNLETFAVDITGAADTIMGLKGDFMKIAESGINSAEDVRFLREAGADAFLVGTSLMKSGDPAFTLRSLYAGLGVSCS